MQLPFGVLEVWWGRHHGLSTRSYAAVDLGNWLALGGTFVFLCVALAIVMGLAGASRQLVVASRGAVLRRAHAAASRS